MACTITAIFASRGELRRAAGELRNAGFRTVPALRHLLSRARGKASRTSHAPVLLAIGAVSAGAAAAWQTRDAATPGTGMVAMSAIGGAILGACAGVVLDLGLVRRALRHVWLRLAGKRSLIVRCPDAAAASAAKQLLLDLGAERVR